jgi:hypothetical protein
MQVCNIFYWGASAFMKQKCKFVIQIVPFDEITFIFVIPSFFMSARSSLAVDKIMMMMMSNHVQLYA